MSNLPGREQWWELPKCNMPAEKEDHRNFRLQMGLDQEGIEAHEESEAKQALQALFNKTISAKESVPC